LIWRAVLIAIRQVAGVKDSLDYHLRLVATAANACAQSV
jgi:hypothetical protein